MIRHLRNRLYLMRRTGFKWLLHPSMQIREMIAALDSEILRLQQVKALLLGTTDLVKVATVPKKRQLSSEARAKITAAQKKRWAKAKKATK